MHNCGPLPSPCNSIRLSTASASLAKQQTRERDSRLAMRARVLLASASLGPATSPRADQSVGHLAAAVAALWQRAASGGGGGSGGGSATAKERAASYLRERERRQTAPQDGPANATAHNGQPRSRLAEAAAEFSEAQQAMFLSSPSGLGVGAEAAIAQAIKEGALDDLAGRGKPLKQEDHGAQFFRVDPLVQAVTRTMGAQNVRPQSLEFRDELQREVLAFRALLASELRAAQAAEAAAAGGGGGGMDAGGERRSSSTGAGAAQRGWLGRLLGRSGSSGGTASSTSGQRPTVATIREGRHPGLKHAWEQVEKLRREYNAAVLSDKETYGSFWPLNQKKALDWGAEVDAAGRRRSEGK